MKTAAAYIRVSTDDQLEYSPDSQLKVIQDYAEKNDIVLLEDCIFMEDGGKSGKSMAKRDKFLELISLSKKKPKPFDMILVWKFSRFARNQEEAITLKSMLKRNNIDVVSISEPLPEGPFGDLIQRIVEWTDEYYLVNLSQEVKRGMKERAGRGEPVNPPPIGYDSKDGKYIPNSDAEFVKGIFTDFLNGIGLRAMAVKYGNLGMRTTRGNMPDNRCIEYMLRNPVYTGKIRWSLDGRAASTRHYDNPNIMITQGKHQPIITEEQFTQVQKKLDEQKKMYGKYQRREQQISWMLKGLVRCSACGATLIAINRKSPSLQCHNYARGTCKISHNITVNKANNAIIEYLENAAITGDFNIVSQNGSQRKDSSTDYSKLIENEKNKLKRITLAYQNGIDSIEEYKVNKARILDSILKLEKMEKLKPEPKIDRAKYTDKIFKTLRVLKDKNKTEAEKNTALRAIIQKIVYHKSEQCFEVYFY